MRTANFFPMRLMQANASGQFHSFCKVYRNDGYGRRLIGESRCNVHHRLTPPVPGDPSDASAASVEFAEIHFPIDAPIIISDTVEARGHLWTVGGGNFSEDYGTYKRAMVGRPIAGTPMTWITLRRYNNLSEEWEQRPPQLAHVAWQKSQPDRLGGISVRQQGYIFAPDGHPSLDIQQGDTFYYSNREALVTWVTPDPSERREATFEMNRGEGS